MTQTRVGGDYFPGTDSWFIGDTTILAHALGLAAFKDTFQTIEFEKQCGPSFRNLEFYPELETTVAAFSGRPVSPGDQYNLYNKTLIKATCMEDGLLLKPTRPAHCANNHYVTKKKSRVKEQPISNKIFSQVHICTIFSIYSAQ